MTNLFALAAKFILNYKGRGRIYYLREMIRPLIWGVVRIKNKHRQYLDVRRSGFVWRLPLADREIASHIFVQGDFNKRQIDQLIGFLRDQKDSGDVLKRNKILIDIGANYGSVSLFFARTGLFKEIHAIEPEPENFEVLQKNIDANGLSSLIKPHHFALSDRDGNIELELSEKNKGDHRVTSRSLDSLQETSLTDKIHVVKVRCKTLDHFLFENRLQIEDIGLIWIDVQGHEGHILSASQVLRKSPVPIYTEFWPYGLIRCGGLELFRKFIINNYHWFIELDTRRPQTKPSADVDRLIKKLGRKGRSTDIFIY